MKESTAFPSLVQYFFAQHLGAHKHASPRTVTAYRDTFRLLLEFLESRLGRPPSALQIVDLDAPSILDFLQHLETDRGNAASSRNLRLCAIKSFFHVVAIRDPANMAIVNRVLAIPQKRTTRKVIAWLTRGEVDAILAAPDRSTWVGSRDHALLLTLYNSGARASEITSLCCGQVTFGAHTFIHLQGKGRKDRTVPLWKEASRVLQVWFDMMGSTAGDIAFPSVRGGPLSTDALDYVIQKTVDLAAVQCPSLRKKRITPHVFRHTTAMHLLQSGVDITVIALWLGHESIETTHGYIEADLAMKEKALEALSPQKGGPAGSSRKTNWFGFCHRCSAEYAVSGNQQISPGLRGSHCCRASGWHTKSEDSMVPVTSRITIEPGKRGGKPCVRGLRITVWDVLGWLGTGMTEEEILDEHPDLEKADFPAVYHYAAEIGRKANIG